MLLRLGLVSFTVCHFCVVFVFAFFMFLLLVVAFALVVFFSFFLCWSLHVLAFLSFISFFLLFTTLRRFTNIDTGYSFVYRYRDYRGVRG